MSEERNQKAKTTAEIYQKYDECKYNEIHGSQRWVPLEVVEDAQRSAEAEIKKLQQSRDFFKEKWNIAMTRLSGYEGQIAEFELFRKNLRQKIMEIERQADDIGYRNMMIKFHELLMTIDKQLASLVEVSSQEKSSEGQKQETRVKDVKRRGAEILHETGAIKFGKFRLSSSKPEKQKKKYVCPARDTCPYEYDACHDPTKFCRIIEDTPEHFSKYRSRKRSRRNEQV